MARVYTLLYPHLYIFDYRHTNYRDHYMREVSATETVHRYFSLTAAICEATFARYSRLSCYYQTYEIRARTL